MFFLLALPPAANGDSLLLMMVTMQDRILSKVVVSSVLYSFSGSKFKQKIDLTAKEIKYIRDEIILENESELLSVCTNHQRWNFDSD